MVFVDTKNSLKVCDKINCISTCSDGDSYYCKPHRLEWVEFCKTIGKIRSTILPELKYKFDNNIKVN